MFGKKTILARVENYNKKGRGDDRHYETHYVNSRDLESTIKKIENNGGEIIKIWDKKMDKIEIEQYQYYLFAKNKRY